MADEETNPSEEENYELVPYKEIEDLKEQLKHLKDVPIPSSKKLQVSMDDLAAKIDRMTAIFEEAGHEIKAEEGGLTFQEKMKPLFEKMNKVLEQNSEIAKGIVAVADLINELKSHMEEGFTVKQSAPAMEPPMPMSQTGTMMPPPRMMPPMPSAPPKRKLGFF
ncbi:hypothetical protein HY493_01235 [Candidatus Woesearchaeota archaeon]|nr:hypothetical protein [Candidatus Woesearchaeota archaeon]